MIKNIINKILGVNSIPINVGKFNESNRVSWLEKTLKGIPTNSRILDAGAGEQQFKKFCSHLNYVSQDFAQYKPEQLNAGLQMEKWDYGKLDLVCDIASIPEPDQSFDAIMCTEVFEHIINPREAIKEFARLLRPDGYLIITAPFSSLTHFAPYHFYTGFNRYFYETELKANGFNIIEIVPNGNYFEFMAQELGRLRSIKNKYSPGAVPDKELKSKILDLLSLLQKLSQHDSGSSELLCFGYHLLARKM